jgi:uncharacterized protein (DUF169 family)
MQFRELAQLFSCILGLKREVVAVHLAATREEYQQLPSQELQRKLSFCMMVRLASLGYGRKAAAAQFHCRGSAEVFLFRKPDTGERFGKRLHDFGLYASQETAGQVQQKIATIAEPCHGVGVSPLGDNVSPPTGIIIFVNSYQAMRLVQAWSYHFGPVDELSLSGNRGVCSECFAKPLSTGALHLSTLCSNTRHLAKWGDDELAVGLPSQKIEEVTDGLIRTIPAVEPTERRKQLMQRCSEAGIDLEIPPEGPYFSSKTSKP